ncbi:Proto-oncogene DBL [Tupaia chinensis]|uniref:Proto-oncogene DBL n=1 Tax=Tupaia chinensis TaxID=246437 RepID=L9J9B7_TUPCH|nr:Proto-oncogene DBL [Tupaia chinensis]
MAAAAESQPHLGSPKLAVAQVSQPVAAVPWTPGLWSRTLALPQDPDGCTFVPMAHAIPLQVDMAMALQRVKISNKYGRSYLCLLQAVYVAGGRGKDNAWIITIPENYNFRCIPEEVIAKVLTYLTSIARQNGSDSQFTVILDRRLDTWSSLKISLQKISVSFPGNLHLVLVLRPTSFLQRTFTDIGFRFSQEDFMLKLPVVMLSSVSDLLTYIDDKQLTPELGGTLQYCHSEWIIFRNAIENFAVTVKEMAQMLQSFGTELAETELPDDIPSIEEILAMRAERYHVLKDDITAVTKEGRLLLTNLKVPDTEETVSSSLECHHQINGDWQTINKLLTQVHDMEIAFDGFWEKHQLKMEQYLQLWKFEQEFQEARQCCDEGECLLANQEIDKFQSKEDAQKALQDIENFLEMALPFINYDPETLQYEFDVLLSPELKMDEVGITEYVKGDNRKFEIWYGEKEEIYIVQVISAVASVGVRRGPSINAFIQQTKKLNQKQLT